MTAEQLEELLAASNHKKWIRGFNDYGNPVARLNHGGIYGTLVDGFKDEFDLLMLAPSLARRVIAAEKLVESLSDAVDAWDAHNKYGDMMQGHWVLDARDAITAYREASK